MDIAPNRLRGGMANSEMFWTRYRVFGALIESPDLAHQLRGVHGCFCGACSLALLPLHAFSLLAAFRLTVTRTTHLIVL